MKPELLRSVLPNVVLPLAVYLLLKPVVDNEVAVLAISAAIPLLVTVGVFAIRRRVDPIGVVAVVGFVVMLTVFWLTGGNELVLKLQEAVFTGPVGLVVLGSALIGKPLLLVVHRFTGHDPAALAPQQRKALTVLTAMIGAGLAVHAGVLLALALSMSTTTFVAVGRPIGWAVIAVGALAVFAYRNRLRAAAEA
ncbi:MAG TPA: VC0807 family protein [Amycolatopsis sp.]|nr:VC0807 family protein [Amycolatopsis sp.]